MTKVYGVQGRTSVEITLQIGKARLPIEFTKGCMDRKNYRPATFTTSDKTIQAMIEGSELYGRMIKLYKTYGENGLQDEEEANEEMPAAAPAAAPAPVAAPMETAVFEDITTIEEVRAKLKSMGAKANTLASTAGMKRFIAAHNIEFPNFTFDE